MLANIDHLKKAYQGLPVSVAKHHLIVKTTGRSQFKTNNKEQVIPRLPHIEYIQCVAFSLNELPHLQKHELLSDFEHLNSTPVKEWNNPTSLYF